jgi:hypothetical protein
VGAELGELTFPASIVLLKFICKLFVDQRVQWLDVGKALLAFPIDIVFLSFSFGSGLLYLMPSDQIRTGTIKSMFGLLVICICVALLTTFICRRSDAALTQSRYWICGLLFVVSYCISVVSIFGALGVRGFLT